MMKFAYGVAIAASVAEAARHTNHYDEIFENDFRPEFKTSSRPHLKASNQTTFEHDSELMQWYLAAIRGMWFGFYRGFYHEQKKPQSTCLSADVED